MRRRVLGAELAVFAGVEGAFEQGVKIGALDIAATLLGSDKTLSHGHRAERGRGLRGPPGRYGDCALHVGAIAATRGNVFSLSRLP